MMKFVLYNRLGMLSACATVCLSLPMMMWKGQSSDLTLAWVVGCALFLIDVSCRVRLYQVAPVSQDLVLSSLSATNGGQFLCLPLWLWGCVIITAMLLQSPVRVLFAISLVLADIVYRLRSAYHETNSPTAALIGSHGLLPPLWQLSCCFLVFSIWRLANLEDTGWPSAELVTVGILISFLALRLKHKSRRRQNLASELTTNTASIPGHQAQSLSSWQRMRQYFPWRQFALGGLIPMLIFYGFSWVEEPLLGAILAGVWGLGVILVSYWYVRRFDWFAGMATAMALTELLVVVITRNPAFYLASEAIQSTAYGLLFLGSLAFSRSLMQCLAEETGSTKSIRDNLRHSPAYRAAWHRLSAVWGVVYLMKTGLLLLAQWDLSLEVFLLIRTLSGLPVLAGLVVFSFWFPGWYWRRRAVVSDGAT